MIKSYRELTLIEKEKLFKKLELKEKISFEEMEKRYTESLFRGGEDVFINFKKEPTSIVEVIFKEVNSLKTGYILLDYLELDKIDDILELIKYSEEILSKEGAINILFSFKTEYEDILETVGIKKEYRSITMELKENEIKEIELLNLEELNEENIDEFLKVYNDSFSDMPHGATMEMEECKEQLKGNGTHYLVKTNSKNIGFLTVQIENDKGIFDIGLCKKFRGFGFGEKLLETAIVTLKSRGAKKIEIVVIEKNRRALNIYRKRGFEIKSIISNWKVLSEIKVDILDEVSAKEACSWKYKGKYSVYNISYREAQKEGYAIAINGRREAQFLSFKLKGELIAYGRIRKEGNECHLGIGIKPKYCGMGLGKLIMNILISEGRSRYSSCSIFVEVRDFNIRAIKCYEKLGFRVVDIYEIIRGERVTFYKMKYIIN